MAKMHVPEKTLLAPNSDNKQHARIQKVLSKGVQQLNSDILLVDEGRKDPNTTKSRSSSACHCVSCRLMMAQH